MSLLREQVNTALRLYGEGKKATEIGREVGVPAPTVEWWVRTYLFTHCTTCKTKLRRPDANGRFLLCVEEAEFKAKANRMSQRRFEPIGVEDLGRRVAVVFDRATEQTYRIHRRGSRFLHWDKRDLRVETQGLRDAAKEALA